MPHTSHLSPDNILRFLQVRSAPASTTEIREGLHLKKSDNRPLYKMLSKLKKRRAIEELPGGRYRLRSPKSDGRRPGQKPPADAAERLEGPAGPKREWGKGRLGLHPAGHAFWGP